MICLCKKRRQLFFFYLFLFLELLNKFKNKFHQINYSYLIILAEIVKKKNSCKKMGMIPIKYSTKIIYVLEDFLMLMCLKKANNSIDK